MRLAVHAEITTSTDVGKEKPEISTADHPAGDVSDAEPVPALVTIEASLRRRFPAVAPGFIHACIDDAAAECAGARVRNFLPILIERRASEALAQLAAGAAPG